MPTTPPAAAMAAMPFSKGVVDPSEQPAPDVVDPSEDLMRHKEYIDTPAEEPQGKKLFIGGISWRSDEGKA